MCKQKCQSRNRTNVCTVNSCATFLEYLSTVINSKFTVPLCTHFSIPLLPGCKLIRQLLLSTKKFSLAVFDTNKLPHTSNEINPLGLSSYLWCSRILERVFPSVWLWVDWYGCLKLDREQKWDGDLLGESAVMNCILFMLTTTRKQS